MLESAFLPVWILLMILLQNALVGGALAAGAWVVWRYLERRASTRDAAATATRW